MKRPYALYPLGDQAITIEFGSAMDEETNDCVHQAFYLFQQYRVEGIRDIIPAYASLTLVFDTYFLFTRHQKSVMSEMMNYAKHVLDKTTPSATHTPRHVIIPACYDVSLGVDLAEMANSHR